MHGIENAVKTNLAAVEAEVNALLDAVRELGRFRDLEQRLMAAADTARRGDIGDERELIGLLETLVRDSKPTLLSTSWEEAWGNLFSHLVQIILSSEGGVSEAISRLYGED